MVRLVVDGQLVSKDYLCVSPLDRAVLYGESAFELLRVYDGRPFEPARHFSELARACDLLSIPRPATQTLFEDLVLPTGGLPGDLASPVQLTRATTASRLMSLGPSTAVAPDRPPPDDRSSPIEREGFVRASRAGPIGGAQLCPVASPFEP